MNEIAAIYPVVAIGYEKVRADVDLTSGRKGARSGKGFSPVMVGQKFCISELGKIAPVYVWEGWERNVSASCGIGTGEGSAKEVGESHGSFVERLNGCWCLL